MNTVQIILELLKEQNKKQRDLTQFLGISETSFADWKRGKTESYKKHIDRIAEFFNVSTDYLLGVECLPNSISNIGTNNGTQANIINNNCPPDTIDIFNNPIVSEAYKKLTEREKLSVQMFILDTAEGKSKE